jgi:hypothetical protein
MPRKPRPLTRSNQEHRDARLIVIASEDTYAVERYFLQFRPKHVQFKVLPAVNNQSSPQATLDRLVRLF